VWGGSIMSERGDGVRSARPAVVGGVRASIPGLALAGLLLLCSLTPSWAAPGDHNGEPSTPAPAASPAVDPALIGGIRDLASNAQALDQLVEVDAAALQQLYVDRNYEPIWVANAGLQPLGEALLDTLERLRRSGALPDDADIAAASARRGATAAAGIAEMELLLSSALIRTAVDPQDLLAPGPRPQVLEAAANSDGSEQFLHQWLPPDPTFWRLRAAIDGYRTMSEHGGWPSVSAGPKLEPGARDGRIAQIRQHLVAAGDLAGDSAEPDLYDDVLL
jgi:murein L,D-transpeptidase YcbB/YkuD